MLGGLCSFFFSFPSLFQNSRRQSRRWCFSRIGVGLPRPHGWSQGFRANYGVFRAQREPAVFFRAERRTNECEVTRTVSLVLRFRSENVAAFLHFKAIRRDWRARLMPKYDAHGRIWESPQINIPRNCCQMRLWAGHNLRIKGLLILKY